MNKLFAIIAGVILLALLLLFTTTYTVSFHEVAVLTRFGQAADDSVVQEEGLHFKLPFFIDQITKFDTRLQLVETQMVPVQVADGQQVLVRAYLMWRVREDGTGPLDFYRSYDDIAAANRSLADRLTDAVGELGSFDFESLLGPNSRVAEAEEQIRERIEANVSDSGIHASAVGLSKMMLPPRTTTGVLGRMQTTRETLANNHRTRGQAQGTLILADATTKADKMRAFAELVAAELRAKGDQKAGEYLASMASRDEQFAIFLTWLEALEHSLASSTTLVLPMDTAPMHLMNVNSPRLASGIPVPSSLIDELQAQSGSPTIPADDGAPAAPGGE